MVLYQFDAFASSTFDYTVRLEPIILRVFLALLRCPFQRIFEDFRKKLGIFRKKSEKVYILIQICEKSEKVRYFLKNL